MVECLSCLPCCSRLTNYSATGSLKGRSVCPGWRMIPGMVALVTCIFGVALCLILKKNPYLCIPFGVGGVCSIYGIYIGYQYKDLLGLHKGVEVLTAQNLDYSRQNAQHAQQLRDGAAQQQTLSRTIGELRQQATIDQRAREEERRRLEESNRRLEEEVAGLSRTNTSLAANVSALDVQLRSATQLNEQNAVFMHQLQAALAARATESDELDGHLTQLAAQITRVQATGTLFGEVKQQLVALIESFNQRAQLQLLTELQRTAAEITAQVAVGQESERLMQERIRELRGVKEQYAAQLGEFQTAFTQALTGISEQASGLKAFMPQLQELLGRLHAIQL
ncbi:MAG: hypothetical protein ACKVOH_06270 [Chlamydiales bacterium]